LLSPFVVNERPAPKQYKLVASPIDDLVADIFKAFSWSPLHFMGNNTAALEAIASR